MTQEVRAIISMCIAGKKVEDRVFTRENEKPIGDFRKTWYKMCWYCRFSENGLSRL